MQLLTVHYVCSLFEIWIAVKDPECTFDIIMPPAQHKSFQHALVTNAMSIVKSLSEVDRVYLML